MNERDIAALMRGVAPVIRDLVASAVHPLTEKVVAIEAEIAELRAVDHAATVADLVADAVEKLPPPEPGRDADPAEVADLVREKIAGELEDLRKAIPEAPELPDFPALIRQEVADAVAAIEIPEPQPGKDADPEVIRQMVVDAVADLPPPKDGDPGKDADPEMVEQLIDEKLAEAVAAIPTAPPGESVTVEDVAPMLSELVASEVAKLPPAEPGKSIEPADVEPMLADMVKAAVEALPPPERGEPGAPGRLPAVKAWTDDVTHEGEVRTHAGATWQATKDTAKEPPHDDWVCIAAAGEPGKDADEIDVIGTYAADGAYKRLNIVALNGGAFIARKDDPGSCPGEGWQVIAMRGKSGEPGKPGPSVKGPPGDPIVAAHIDDQGLLMLVNGDGSTVECDLYPLLSKVK